MAEAAAVVALDVKPESGGGYPEPFNSRMGDADWRRLGNVFGLTQFGINLETFQPGAQSSLRHWHTTSSSISSKARWCCGPTRGTRSCDRACAPGSGPACAMRITSSMPGDGCFYPDDDLMWVETEQGSHAAHKDGTRY
jgi:hypothetical protein